MNSTLQRAVLIYSAERNSHARNKHTETWMVPQIWFIPSNPRKVSFPPTCTRNSQFETVFQWLRVPRDQTIYELIFSLMINNCRNEFKMAAVCLSEAQCRTQTDLFPVGRWRSSLLRKLGKEIGRWNRRFHGNSHKIVVNSRIPKAFDLNWDIL